MRIDLAPVPDFCPADPLCRACISLASNFAEEILPASALIGAEFSLSDSAGCIDNLTRSSAKTQRPSQQSRSADSC
jgi:hypothetical protein